MLEKRIYIRYNTSGISNLSDSFRKDIVNLRIDKLVPILNKLKILIMLH